MSKREMILILDIKHQITQEHEDLKQEVPERLLQEIDELEQKFLQRIKGA
ncbi:hypothetical protein KS872_004642 [Vibrio parahaemolyticus]|nr:hypothetical protein [Vibrio parahaemolyticus]EHR0574838.1 hypothetical protein [Vibrio parahaemolyticus]EJA3094932.1 hypothetical protein [Vibrio parahaemolyticus]EME0114525.1 hypothetical protein [Vibrio parahaemolyticus]MBD6984053.1 hypothetical protein [Vibrio parahaemolyticus]MBD6987301.1 hypothetical protein [Vibrio parahaemolyticus]